MGRSNEAGLLNMLTVNTAEPNYSKKLAFFKAALVGYAGSIPRGEPHDELRRVFIEKMAEMDKLFVRGECNELSRMMDAHTVNVLATYHAFLIAYLSVPSMSDEKARSLAQKLDVLLAQTASRTQVKNVKHGLRLDRAERDKGKKTPGGQRKPGGVRAQKDVMRAIKRKQEFYAKAGGRVPGIKKLLAELRGEGKAISWDDGYLGNLFSRWDPKKDAFKGKPAHGS